MTVEFLKSKRKQLIAAGLVLVFVLLFILRFLSLQTESTDNAYLKSDIIIIKPKVTGYIVKAIANDNQFLRAGQLIAKIDDRDYHLKLKKAKEHFKSAKAKLDSLIHQIKIQQEELNKALAYQNSASAKLERASKEYKRTKELLQDHAISQAIFDQARETFISAESEYLSSTINIQAAKHKQEIAILEMKEAEALLKATKAEFHLAQIDLENTEIRAMTDGRITKKSLQIGQLVSPNLSLGYLVQNKTWVIANFKEVQTGKMKPGQKVLVTIDSFPNKSFKASIDSIAPATGSEFSILPPENATGNFTKIVQRVPVKIVFNEDQDLELLRPGLSCEVKVSL